MGLGFLINAVSNPNTHFEGVDFNPLHIAHAQGLADAADIENVTLREASFQDLVLEIKEGQHDLDLIVLHGILTWVSIEAQEAIVEIARKRLKPGGFLYVSYNCMPGWAPVLPLQRLMRENAKRTAGRSDAQTAAGLDLVQGLLNEGAGYFAATPSLASRIEKMFKLEKNYLAHEYLNANWYIFHVSDVAAMFGKAKLEFICSATVVENIDNFSIPSGVRSRIAAEADPIFRETLRDVAANKQFRRDIFAKGASTTLPAEQAALFSRMSFALVVPRSKVNLKFASPLGEIEGSPDMYNPVLDLLAHGSATLAELISLPVFQSGSGAGVALQIVSLLVHSGQILPVPMGSTFDPSAAQRFNRVIADKMSQGRNLNFLAAPHAGSGIQASNIELLLLAAIFEQPEISAKDLAVELDRKMRAIGINWVENGQAVVDAGESLARSRRDVDLFVDEKLPIWRQLGVI